MKAIALKTAMKERPGLALALAGELLRRRYRVAVWRQNQPAAVGKSAVKILYHWTDSCCVVFPNRRTLQELLPYSMEEYVILEEPCYGVPNIAIKEKADGFSMASVNHDDISVIADLIVKKTPELLPFPADNPCCTACSWQSCTGLLQAILAEEATTEDCPVRQPDVMVCVGGQDLPMVQFVQNIIRSVNLTLLKQLDGVVEGREIVIRINR